MAHVQQAAPSPAGVLRIAHLSDLHLRHHQPGVSLIANRRSRQMPALLKQALVEVKKARVDLVVITGDLLDAPYYIITGDSYHHHDHAAWEHEITADYQLVHQLLERSGIPYVVIPGNHDHYPLFGKVFGDGSRELAIKGYRVLAFHDREWLAHTPQRIDRERRRWVAALTGGDQRPQVHLQHFLVTPDHSQGYPHNYFECRQMLERNAASPVPILVLAGHYHRGVQPETHGSATYSTVPAFSHPPFAYRLYTLQADRLQSWVERSISRKSGRQKVVFLDRDGWR